MWISSFRTQAPSVVDYSTTFPNTEAHTTQGGAFVVGDNGGSNAATGPQSDAGAPGVAYAHAADGIDYLAVYQGNLPAISGTSQFVELTIKRTGGYVAPDTQEVEALAFFTLSSGLSSGYEFDLWFGGTTCQVVRWNNGATSSYDFAAISPASGDPNIWPGSLVDGDVVRIEAKVISGNPTFWVYVNGVPVRKLEDVTAGKITSGQPGFGFFVRTGTGVDMKAYALKGWRAGTF